MGPGRTHDVVGSGDVSKGLAAVGDDGRGSAPRSGCVQVSWLVPAEESSLASRLWLLLYPK